MASNEGERVLVPPARVSWLRKFLRYATGAHFSDNPNSPVPWREYAFDICGWSAVFALVAALVYIGYQGLVLAGG